MEFERMSPQAGTLGDSQGTEAAGQADRAQDAIRIAYVTSPREIADEGVGTDRKITPTLEYLHNNLGELGRRLGVRVEIGAVFVDDDGRKLKEQRPDGKKEMKFLEQPTEAFRWLSAFCAIRNIPMKAVESIGWRDMRIYSRDSEGNLYLDPVKTEAKHNAKVSYEQEMLAIMRQHRIDVIVSDSYMPLFNSVMLGHADKTSTREEDACLSEGFDGLIINIHPAHTHELPGTTPTADALARARIWAERQVSHGDILLKLQNEHEQKIVERTLQNNGVYFIHGKLGIYVRQDFEPELAVAMNRTGATLHYVDWGVDTGAIIHSVTDTPVFHGEPEQDLRSRNYGTSKNPLLIEGIVRYLSDERNQQRISENRVHNRSYAAQFMPAREAFETGNGRYGRAAQSGSWRAECSDLQQKSPRGLLANGGGR